MPFDIWRLTMLYTRQTDNSFEDVCKRIQAEAKQDNLGIIAVIDLKEKLNSKGVDFKPQCRIIELCEPAQAKLVLRANMAISTVLPCRISVYEEAGKVTVTTLKPSAVLSLFGNPEIQPIAEQMEDVIIRVIDAACLP
jgi:uncharacterized protein (DUF302 family)